MRSVMIGTSFRLTVSLIMAVALAGCNAKSEEAAMAVPPAPEVEVARVQTEEVVLWGSFTGRIAAPETVEIRSRVSGYIDRIEFDEGQLVERGDLLFVIDQRPYQARVDLAHAELAQEKSQLELASSEAARASKLWENRAISDEELERRTAAVVAARAAVEAASARLASAQLELEYTQVRAPISGRIGRAELTHGDLASADVSRLATVVSVDPIYVYFDSDQQTVLGNGQGSLLGTPVRVRLGADDDQYRAGRVDFVDNRYNSQTGTLQYRALLENADGYFKPGQFARVQMPVSDASETVLLDQKAVLTDQDRRYVYVLDEHNKVSRRYVVVGRRFNGLQVIHQGLRNGDRVVVNGLQKIAFPGMQVSPQLVEMQRDSPQSLVAENTAS